MERIACLREEALHFSLCRDEFYYRFYKTYASADGTEAERYGDAFVSAFEGLTPIIGEGELIVGRIEDHMNDEERAEWEHTYRGLTKARCDVAGGGQDSHMAIDYALLLRGGFEMQINVTDREILERARENPEEYGDLVVRIGGYSDYFTRLSPQMQNELILRTEHKI